jgi:transposase
MAHLHKKMKKGRPYYYIREFARVGGKPKVVSQIYLGSLERLAELAKGERAGGCSKIVAQEFGVLWLANLIDQSVGLVSMIDAVVPRKAKETGPSVGEYFLYATFNRMIDSCSKRAIPDWYRHSAIQHIRPVDIQALDSQHYWEKWDRVEQEHIEAIASRFFQHLTQLEKPDSDCFLFDTTNYYTYMASDTESELAQRGKNKEGKDWLRQVGVALLVSRGKRMPLFYREFEGNRHDSKLFGRILKEVLNAMQGSATDKGELTLVFDKGMNSEDNMAAIDAAPGVHFITTYSPYFADELIRTKLSQFKTVDTVKNRELVSKGQEEDQLVAWRTQGLYWGKERTVIVTHNPRTAAKQRYAFDKKLLSLQEALSDLRERVASQKPHWTDARRVAAHYEEACERLHLPRDLYAVSIEKPKDKWRLLFHKNHYRIGKHLERFGKNIIISNHLNWSTDEIVQASLDRYVVEDAFRQSKDDDLVSVQPLRHWTDSKIRCHILSCVIALAYLRLIEIRLQRAVVSMTADNAMQHLHRLHSCLWWSSSAEKPKRTIEEPTETQAQILKAFGYEIVSGVLHPISK